MGLTVWAEARGESINGKVAVACVIRNRMAKRRQGVVDVCLAPAQFSCWDDAGGAANYRALAAQVDALAADMPSSDPVVRECIWVAEGVLAGVVRDNVKGADHYLTTALLSSTKKPGWVAAMAWAATVDSHAFYRS